ncbi:MAG: cytochrome c biogenesis CcdA family protein [Candidatus Dormibacteria bacterium]
MNPGEVGIAFSAGALSFFAPCVVPLLPAYVSAIVGVTPAEMRRSPGQYSGRLIRGGLLYVIGFASVFVALGLLAGVAGSALKQQEALAQRIGGVLVILMGLALAGLLPAGLSERSVQLLPGRGSTGSRGTLFPLVLGVVFGTAWTPCVGPVLAGVLVLAASSGHALTGGILLAGYALGLGIPFIFVSLLLASFPVAMRPLARAGAWAGRVAGALMIVLGILLVLGLYSTLAGYLAAPFTLR